MLATLGSGLPAGEDWSFEIKWDGYRIVARVAGGRATLVSRNNIDATARFGTVAEALPRALGAAAAVVDGEVCALDGNGWPSFQLLQRSEGTLVYYVFDLLELDGAPLVDRPLRERRAALDGILDEDQGAVRVSRTFPDGAGLLAAAREHGLEGIMAKRADSRYLPGRRTRDWLKVKNRQVDVFAIAGYTQGEGARKRLGSLVLAARDGSDLVYAGNCGTGFTEDEIDRLLAALRPLRRDDSPLSRPVKDPRLRRGRVTWCEPRLRARIELTEWTNAGHARAPAYKGLVEETTPVAEVPHTALAADEPSPAGRAAPPRLTALAGNLDRVLFPDDGITKGDLVAYYHAVAPVLLPHLRDRAFVLRRAPEGITRPFFFAKDVPPFAPAWLARARIPAETRGSDGRPGSLEAPVVCDEASLLWLVGIGCIDLHVTLSRVDRIQEPDSVLFDLDPSGGATFAEACAVALHVRDALAGVGLEAYVKTSGQTGLHVTVPIERGPDYARTRAFAHTVALAVERVHPALATTVPATRRRRGVLIDWRQNHVGASIATAYSVRPVPGAPVSCPLTWDEVEAGLDPAGLTMAAVQERVARLGDLYAPTLGAGQQFPAAR
jgi:bifunctional non-homologous end joining protein LigD